MSKLPVANFKTMDKILRRLGFTAVRQKGSHIFYRHKDGRAPHFPIMEGETSPILPGLLPWKRFDRNIIAGDTVLNQDCKEFIGSLNDNGVRFSGRECVRFYSA